MAFPVFSKNGEILPSSEAVVPLSDIAYAYGFGVYENVRVIRGRALFLADHLERLLHSATMIGLEHPLSTGVMAAWTEELLRKVDAEACNLKMLLIGGATKEAATFTILPLAPLFPDRKLYKTGASAVTVPYERYLPHAKSLNMLGSYLAYRIAKNAGCYDALLVNRSGCITEGTRTNFFAIKERTIVSPPEEDILEGVTRKHVLEVATANGFTVEHRPIPKESLGQYDGVFLTSTSSKIMPLGMIDGMPVAVPAAVTELIGHFEGFLKTAEGI